MSKISLKFVKKFIWNYRLELENDDEEHCFLKLFGFIKKLKISIELAFWQTVVCKYARAQVERSRLKLPQE